MSNPVDITDATDATYTLVDADLGKTLKVRVTFDDDAGSTETLTSAATVTVTPAAGAPNPPRNLSATVGVGQVVLVWQHSQGGGITHSHYEYRFSAGAMISPDAMWQQASSSPGFPNTAYYQVVKGLTSGTSHTLQVRAAKRSRRKRAGDRDRDTNITAVLHHRRVGRPAPALAGPTGSSGTKSFYRWKCQRRKYWWGRDWNPDTCCGHLPFNHVFRHHVDIRRSSLRCPTRRRHGLVPTRRGGRRIEVACLQHALRLQQCNAGRRVFRVFWL